MLLNLRGKERRLLKSLKYYFFINVNLKNIKESFKYIFLYSFTKEKIKSKTLFTMTLLFDIKDFRLVNLKGEMKISKVNNCLS
jgi:hypothetical protein